MLSAVSAPTPFRAEVSRVVIFSISFWAAVSCSIFRLFIVVPVINRVSGRDKPPKYVRGFCNKLLLLGSSASSFNGCVGWQQQHWLQPSATCLAALFMLSKAELAAATALLTAATATSEPAGADLAAGRAGQQRSLKSPNCASNHFDNSS